MKGLPGASPEMAAGTWPACRDTIKENHFSGKKVSKFRQEGTTRDFSRNS